MSGAEFDLVPAREGYDRWAEIYDTDGNPLVALEELHFDRALGEVRGLELLDLGCGTGRHALRLARAGARVTALDFSAGMLARARASDAAGSVRFLAHDLHEALPCADASFDRAVSGLVLEHLSDLTAFFRELCRVLRPGGRALVSTIHPALRLKSLQARFTDPRTGRETRLSGAPQEFSALVLSALAAELRIVHLSEHAPDAALAQRFPRAEKYVGWPMLVLLGLERPRA